ncbi:hypothetical protein ACKVMT_05625 [Halobacteriales archaeon Cl-PHB]
MSGITLEGVTADDGRLEVRVSRSPRLARFFAEETFVATYDVDLSGVPESVLVIPALAHVCPVAWAAGADVAVDRVDARFVEALEDVQETLCEMYPEFMAGGDLQYGEAVSEPPARDTDGHGLLFSGGADSTASYVRHRDEDPTLISVHGWVVGVDEADRWGKTQDHIEQFADGRGLDTRYVRSNMLQFLDTPMLHAHFKRYLDGSWYSGVGHGLGLLGLCAPLTYRDGLGTLYVAATHTEEFDVPWGSHPTIDDNVAWTATEGKHDGYGLSRQEKLELIADYIRQDAPTLTLRTCTNDEAGGNCGECEKCYRTAVGLLLAGVDPNDHGYELHSETYERIRAGFENGEWLLGEDERFMWEDIQRHVDLDRDYPSPEARAFFEWLATVDVADLVERGRPPLRHRLVRAAARHTPYPVYASLYPVYDQIKHSFRRVS